jgi:hypothetical protein
MTKVREAVAVFSVLFAVGLLGMAGGAWRQDKPLSPRPPRTFGTASEVAHVILSYDMNVYTGTAATSNHVLRYCAVPDCGFYGGVHLPAGAIVSRIELEACVSSDAGEIRFALERHGPLVGGVIVTRPLTAGLATGTDVLECDFFTSNLPTPETIDNETYTYVVAVSPGTSVGASFLAVRLYYTLQVSPAPAVASFGDVPTNHPFFGFIEALKASGITGGCQGNPPLYCPDQAVTRGQMAVFLSKALGLHFAPLDIEKAVDHGGNTSEWEAEY